MRTQYEKEQEILNNKFVNYLITYLIIFLEHCWVMRKRVWDCHLCMKRQLE
jgi:hypothetical protein